MASFRKSIVFSFSDRYATVILNVVTTAVLARLLAPAEVGTYIVVLAIISLANTVREFGLPAYLIQKREISEECIRTAFTITFHFSVAIAVALILLREPLAEFYGEPEIAQGIVVTSAAFLVLPFSVTITALLHREMAFSIAALCSICGALINSGLSVLLAFLGFGFMGPLWGWLAGTVALAAISFAFRPNIRVFRPSFRNWREVLSFGSYASASGVLNVLYPLSPQLILGRLLDLTAAGLFSRAVIVSQLFDKLVLDAIRPVVFPAISEKVRIGADLKDTYLAALECLAAVHWPFLLFTALMADPMVGLLFGSQWSEIIPLVRLLCLAALSLFPLSLMHPILVSMGHMRDFLVASIVTVPLSVLILLSASFFGLYAVGLSTFVIALLHALVAVAFVRRRVPFRMGEFARALRRSALVTAGSMLGPLMVVGIGGFDLEVSSLGLVAAAVSAGVCWWVAAIATGHPLAHEVHGLFSRLWPFCIASWQVPWRRLTRRRAA